MEATPPTSVPDARQTRLRVKQACGPCKDRKRRCDGEVPCSTCTRYEYDCFYEELSRKRRRRTIPASPVDEILPKPGLVDVQRTPQNHLHYATPSQAANNGETDQRKEVNPGSAFAKLLGQQLGAERASEQQLLAWNIGMSEELSELHMAITKIITLDQLQSLSQVYFDTVHQAFAFIDREAFDKKAVDRWARGDVGDPQDPLLCGVAVLGSLFSGGPRNSSEGALVDCAKATLEAVDVLSFPTYDQVGGWLLRTMFLRCTARPHAAWIASSTTMHTIEAIAVEEGEEEPDDPTNMNIALKLFSKARVVWLSRLFNTWISNEYGRSRVDIKGNLPTIPIFGDDTSDLLRLFQISESLTYGRACEATDFERGIADVIALKTELDGLTLSRANAVFTFYRRLRLLASIIPQSTIDHILALGVAGLDAAQRMASRRQPWWHVANVPFQFVCVLLVMDSKDSLAHIGRAMATLQAVSDSFSTKSIANSVAAARKLIKLTQQRKLDDVVFLDQGLEDKHYCPHQQAQSILTVNEGNTMAPNSGWQPPPELSAVDFTTLDWDPFLSMDIPIFDGLGLPLNTGPSFYVA